MLCCQRTPDDEVVKPQQDGKKKKYNIGNIEMEQKISGKIFLSFTKAMLLTANIFQFLHDKQSLLLFHLEEFGESMPLILNNDLN